MPFLLFVSFFTKSFLFFPHNFHGFFLLFCLLAYFIHQTLNSLCMCISVCVCVYVERNKNIQKNRYRSSSECKTYIIILSGWKSWSWNNLVLLSSDLRYLKYITNSNVISLKKVSIINDIFIYLYHSLSCWNKSKNIQLIHKSLSWDQTITN